MRLNRAIAAVLDLVMWTSLTLALAIAAWVVFPPAAR